MRKQNPVAKGTEILGSRDCAGSFSCERKNGTKTNLIIENSSAAIRSVEIAAGRRRIALQNFKVQKSEKRKKE